MLPHAGVYVTIRANRNKKACSSMRLALFLLALLATTTAHALTRAEVESIVQSYIATHGNEILQSIITAQEAQKAATAKEIIRPHNPTSGPATAPITIVEFSEFECPFCQRVQANLKPVRDRYGTRIRWVYKHFPLEFHAKAKPAALAAQAAHNQGKFWEFAAKIWPRQNYLSEQLLVEIAKELKLDMAKFNADRASPAAQKALAQDIADGKKAGVQGTPFFLINGTPLSGAQPTEAFVEIIEAELAKHNKAEK